MSNLSHVFNNDNYEDQVQLTTHVNHILTGWRDEDTYSDLPMVEEASQYDKSKTFLKEYEKDTRWMIYHLATLLEENIRRYTKNRHLDLTKHVGVLDIRSRKPITDNEVLVLIAQKEQEIDVHLCRMVQTVKDNLTKWCLIRDEYGLIQPFTHHQLFRHEVYTYIAEAWENFKRSNHILYESGAKRREYAEQSIRMELNHLANGSVRPRYVATWYPRTIVDLLERKEFYKKFVKKQEQNTFSNFFNKIGDAIISIDKFMKSDLDLIKSYREELIDPFDVGPMYKRVSPYNKDDDQTLGELFNKSGALYGDDYEDKKPLIAQSGFAKEIGLDKLYA